jgi:V/A-type H+/Na+-transporting ATPase subunit I
MFRPRSMRQVEILLLRRDLAASLRALAAARIIHLYRLEAGSAEKQGVLAEEEDLLAGYREFIGRVDRLLEGRAGESAVGRILEPLDFPAWAAWAADLQGQLGALRDRQRQLQRCRLRLVAIDLFLRRLRLVEGAFATLANLRLSCLRLGLLPTTALAELATLPGGCRVYPLARLGNQSLIAVLGLRRQEQPLERSLNHLAFYRIPLFRRVQGTLGDVAGRIHRLRARLHRRQRQLHRKVEGLLRAHATLLRDRRYTVAVEMQLLEQQREFGYTRRTVAIGGWVPARRFKELQNLLQQTCHGRFQIRETAARGDETPVLIFNPRLLRPFQKILAAYGVPTYREIEPTPLLAFGFMLLFGMMFGDLGHGLVLIVAGLAVRRWSRWRDEGLIMSEVGCFAALFGVLFGSVFGWEGLFHPLWFSPLADIPLLMGAALAVGVGLITAGMLLRVVNGLRQEAARVVLTDRYGVAGIGFYLGSLVLGYLVYRSVLAPGILALLVLPLAAVFFHPFTEQREKGETPAYLLCAEGFIEVIETILGFLANTFSFLRVAAFGLAHVGLSLAVFALAEQAQQLPLGLFFAGLVHLLGNLVILVLEGLIVSIQAVRLEFYEFFGKFFRGGGIRFRPLALDPLAERRF